jgi:chromosome segregation ATPase
LLTGNLQQTSYNKELTSKSSQISTLENSLNNITRDKNNFFDQLQLRQGELESAQAHADTIQHQNTELEFQLREANDRFALVREEYSELQREMESRSREPTVSADEIARVVSAMEVKYEARLAEVKRNISLLEQEHHESEVDWSKKLTEKVREVENLKKILGSATRMREKEERMVADVKTELEAAQETNEVLRREAAELTLLKGQIVELEARHGFKICGKRTHSLLAVIEGTRP